jgi:hypothetical protein
MIFCRVFFFINKKNGQPGQGKNDVLRVCVHMCTHTQHDHGKK